MKLTDLSPRWLTPDTFIFKNPTGGSDWLSCTRVGLTHSEQQKLFYKDNPDLKRTCIVGTTPGYAWAFKGNDFATLTVTPSIDASRSGNWHGFVTNGNIA